MKNINVNIKKIVINIICIVFTLVLLTSCVTKEKKSVSHVTPERNVTMIELNNGALIPSIGLRSSNYELGIDSESKNTVDATVVFSVETALKRGYRHIDSDYVRNNIESVSLALQNSGVKRENVWISVKIWPGDYGVGLTRNAIENVLAVLKTDYIDCAYLNYPIGDYKGAWQDLIVAYKNGKVRSLGLSNFDDKIEAFEEIMEMDKKVKPQLIQMEFHPYAQRKEMIEKFDRDGIKITCWYPMAGGDEALMNDPELKKIADKYNKTVAQIILRFEVEENHIVAASPTVEEYIEANIDIFDFELTNDEMNKIRTLDKGETGRKFVTDYTRVRTIDDLN